MGFIMIFHDSDLKMLLFAVFIGLILMFFGCSCPCSVEDNVIVYLELEDTQAEALVYADGQLVSLMIGRYMFDTITVRDGAELKAKWWKGSVMSDSPLVLFETAYDGLAWVINNKNDLLQDVKKK